MGVPIFSRMHRFRHQIANPRALFISRPLWALNFRCWEIGSNLSSDGLNGKYSTVNLFLGKTSLERMLLSKVEGTRLLPYENPSFGKTSTSFISAVASFLFMFANLTGFFTRLFDEGYCHPTQANFGSIRNWYYLL